MTGDRVDLVTTAPEVRQIARVLEFDARLADHVSWENVARTARDLGADFDTRRAPDGAITVTIFWRHTEEELIG